MNRAFFLSTAIAFFALASCAFMNSELVAQDSIVRKWTSGDFEVVGKLLDRTDSQITIQTNKFLSVKVKIELLSE